MIKYIIILSVVLLILAVVLFIILPLGDGRPITYLDENGTVLKGSVCEKTFIKLDHSRLGMFITGKAEDKPVILFCSSGPGLPEYLLESFYPTSLSDEYVVCYMEFRGNGLSYDSSLDSADVTTDQYISDTIAITNYLRERFNKDKIYIMGHSFGTYIALRTVQLYPDYYHSYIAISQMCNQMESEKEAYHYMKEQYEQTGNQNMVKKFKKYNIDTSKEDLEKYISSSLRDTAMHELGVGTTRYMHSVITGILFPSLQSKAYTQAERINIWKGKIRSFHYAVVYEAWHFNAFDKVSSIEVPIFFFAGKYDYTCCYSLQKQYYEQINAPEKKFYTFKESAHSPLFEEPEKAISILKNEIIK
ncbi:MAG TPA: alpha/beta hydrolase [Lachnospiraceae bacterium]|nr:alpha/beta hydrolase [Lachnospiraceae bacterium]